MKKDDVDDYIGNKNNDKNKNLTGAGAANTTTIFAVNYYC